jgi:hypothetical protein
MKSITFFAGYITLLLAPLIAAGPLPLFSDCVCVTEPCPCNGSATDFALKRSLLKAREDPLVWCSNNLELCKAIAKSPIKREAGVEERSPLPPIDPLKWCLANWDDCEQLGGFKD